jgi:hypothetical protein
MAFLYRYLPLSNALAVIAHQHDGNQGGSVGGSFLDPLNLEVKPSHSGKARATGGRVDNDKPFAVANPLVPESWVILLTSCIENIEHAGIPINNSLLSIRVFDGWVVGFDIMIQAELFIGG